MLKKLINKILRKERKNYDGRKCVTLSGKKPKLPDHCGAPAPIDPKTGMHKDYWILSEEELKKGFIRPVREVYLHLKCLTTTRMNLKIAETYARDNKFYGLTYCCTCKDHFPVDEFVWENTNIKVGA